MTYYDRLRASAAALTVSMSAGFVLLARARPPRAQSLGVVCLIVASSATWLTTDHLAEGAILVRVSSSHGLTVADLVALAGLGEATALATRCLGR